MNKRAVYLGATVGGIAGSYIPIVLFHAGDLSAWSLLGGLIGGIAGIWAVVKLYGSV